MNESNHPPRPDPLGRAIVALLAAPVPPGPPPDLVAATLAAIAPPNPPARPHDGRRAPLRRRLMRYTFAGIAASALAAAVLLLAPGGSASAAVRDALDNAGNAESFKMTTRTQAGGQTVEVIHYESKGRSRLEVGKEMVVVTDSKARKELTLDLRAKTAALAAVADDPAEGADLPDGAADFLSDFTGKLTELKGDGVKKTGSATHDGRKVDVYEVSADLAGRATAWTVWIDPAAKLPVRLAASVKGQAMAVTIEYSDWGAEFDPKLFSLEAPAGFKPAEGLKKAK